MRIDKISQNEANCASHLMTNKIENGLSQSNVVVSLSFLFDQYLSNTLGQVTRGSNKCGINIYYE